jgi:hypothetical protein
VPQADSGGNVAETSGAAAETPDSSIRAH